MDTKHQSILKAAIAGFEMQRDQIERQIAQLHQELNPMPVADGTTPIDKPKRTMTEAARKRMAAGQKRRWKAFYAAKKRA